MQDSITHIKSYLGIYERLGNNKRIRPETVLLQNGVALEPADKPEDIIMGEKKQCFCNAFRLASASNRYIYCEGYAVPDITLCIPIYHAWVYDLQTEQVVDNTWTGALVYYGILFNTNYVAEVALETNVYGNVLYQREFVLAKDRSAMLHEEHIRLINQQPITIES